MSDTVRVGLLFGGSSVEHEISVISARGVAAALREAGLGCVPIAVTGEGRWLSPELSRAILDGPAARVEPAGTDDDGTRLLVDPGGGGLLRLDVTGAPREVPIDVVFPLLHGWGGEDGRVQGALELAGIPYVGAGVLGSAAGMDKAVAKELFRARGLSVVPWVLTTRGDWRDAARAIERSVVERVGLPLFVKPANGGSSVGISKVARASAMRPALELAFAHDRRVVVEQALDSREIECAVIGNDSPEASGLGEILPSREYYDYAAKYLDGKSQLKIPAELEPAQERALREQALEAFRVLDLCGFARVDFLLDRRTGQAYVNEVNTLPGFTPISMFPKLWEAAGLSYPRLVARLVRLARERWCEESERATRWCADGPPERSDEDDD